LPPDTRLRSHCVGGKDRWALPGDPEVGSTAVPRSIAMTAVSPYSARGARRSRRGRRGVSVSRVSEIPSIGLALSSTGAWKPPVQRIGTPCFVFLSHPGDVSVRPDKDRRRNGHCPDDRKLPGALRLSGDVANTIGPGCEVDSEAIAKVQQDWQS